MHKGNSQSAGYMAGGVMCTDVNRPCKRLLSQKLDPALQYGMHEGTSQSAGYVAGGAALLLAAYRAAGFPNMTGALVRDALMSGVVQTDDLADKCQSGARMAWH